MGREPAGASELAASLQGKGYRMRNAADLDPLLDQVGDARYVLLGPPARRGSWEDVCHQAFAQDTLLLLTRLEATPVLTQRRGHRAVGMVYHPEAEIGNYVPTVLPQRYDAFLYLDTTQALHPLYDVPARSQADVSETYPSGV